MNHKPRALGNTKFLVGHEKKKDLFNRIIIAKFHLIRVRIFEREQLGERLTTLSKKECLK